MNPRIKELAKQAGLSYIPSKYSDVEDLYRGADSELEKFAELVMKDTMRVVAKQLPGNVYLDVAEAVIKHYEGDA